MKNTAKKNTQKEAITKKNATKKEGRTKDMKKNNTVFDINAHNNNMILEHADGSREAITAEDIKEKALKRYEKEKVSTLRKWAKARGIASADTLKKAALIVVLAEDDIKPKEEKAAAKKEKKEAAKKKDKAAKEAAKPKEKKNAPKEAAPKLESVLTSFEKEDARIVIAIDVANMQNVEIADAMNRIKEQKLFESKGAASMKEFVDKKCATDEDIAKGKKGKYHGFSYSTVNTYINAHKYVYSMKDKNNNVIFESYGMHLIQALVTPCKYFSEAVREAVKDKRITADMSLEELKKLINSEAWTKAKDAKTKDKAAANTNTAEEEATKEDIPKAEKHNGVTDEAAEAAAAILSAFIDEAKAPKVKKEAATKALDTLMKRADI